jgi:hypothetical protein
MQLLEIRMFDESDDGSQDFSQILIVFVPITNANEYVICKLSLFYWNNLTINTISNFRIDIKEFFGGKVGK